MSALRSPLWKRQSVLLALLLAACGDGAAPGRETGGPGRETGPSDAGREGARDSVPGRDGPVLAACDAPGQPCKASDPCAIDATCGEDRRCHPTKVHACDDGLECTADRCLGAGACEHAPKPGYCVITEVSAGKQQRKCVSHGQAAPGMACMICDEARQPLGWSPAEGGSCDDGDPCTKSDGCHGGLCLGTFYGSKCDDGVECTDDLCDGSGGCLPSKLKADHCQIGGVCYRDGEHAPSGCQRCDVSKSQSAWTTLTSSCTIGGACLAPGDKQPGGCGVCDPAQSSTAWTPLPAACVIGGACYKAGEQDQTGCGVCDVASPNQWTVASASCLINRTCTPPGTQHPGGCASCDPSKDKLGWTPAAGKCLLAGACVATGTPHASGCLVCDAAKQAAAWSASGAATVLALHSFDSGTPLTWTTSSTTPQVRWTVSDRRSASGGASLYYGDPATGTYRSGTGANAGTVQLPAVMLAAGKKAGLTFALYLDVEADTSFDVLEVKAGGKSLWKRSALTLLRSWQQVSIDLTAYAGTSVVIQLSFETVDGNLNSSEGVFVDDLTIYHGC